MEMKEHVIETKELLPKHNLTESAERSELLTEYKDLIGKHSNTISLLRKIVTHDGNTSTGLSYKDISNGCLISVAPCKCVPTPPSHSGLELTSIRFDCGGNSSSRYEIQCSGDGGCDTHAWPSCEEDLAAYSNITWEYTNCQKVPRKTCGSWKTSTINMKIGMGVFIKESY